MPEPKVGTSANGAPMHYSVGAVIVQNGRYLLINRLKPPPGWAGPAGHVDEGEDPENAIIREVREETGLTVTRSDLLFAEEVDGNWCRRGTTCHHWCLYACEVTGDLVPERLETKAVGWLTPNQMLEIELEEVWEYWFRKLGVLVEKP